MQLTYCESECIASRMISEPLVKLIVTQYEYPYQSMSGDQLRAKSTVCQQRRQQAVQAAENLKPSHPIPEMDLANEKGASNWLTSLPIEGFGFCLHKGAFTNALALGYGWTPSQIPMNCACGNTFSVNHALSCPRGGFPTIHHNEIRDITFSLLT